jgi:hypothetical protein
MHNTNVVQGSHGPYGTGQLIGHHIIIEMFLKFCKYSLGTCSSTIFTCGTQRNVAKRSQAFAPSPTYS